MPGNGTGIAYVVSGTFGSASIVAKDTDLILSASATSVVAISGNLFVLGNISSNNLDSRYTLTSSYGVFTASINNFTSSINGFTASFTSSVQSIGDLRYTRTINSLLGALTITAGPNITINSAGTNISITGSGGGSGITTSLNGYSGSLSILAGPNVTINSGSGFIMITGSAGAAPTDISALNSFSSSVNIFTASHNTFSQSINGFTASFTSSVQSIGDARYIKTVNSLLGDVTITAGPNITINTVGQNISITGSAAGSGSAGVASINGYSGSISILAGPNITVNSGSGFIMITGSAGAAPTDISALNTFSASHNIFSQSVNGFTASFTASVQSIGDARYASLSTFNTFSSSINGFTSSFSSSVSSIVSTTYGPFTSSISTLTQSLNLFSASINVFSQSINGFTASFTASVQSIGDARYVTAVTGSDNFFITNLLKVSGTITNPVGYLILSSTLGSVIAASSSLDFANTDKKYHIRSLNGNLILSSSAGSVYISGNLFVQSTVFATGTSGNPAIVGYGGSNPIGILGTATGAGQGVKGVSSATAGSAGVRGEGVIGVQGVGTFSLAPGVTGLGAGGGNGRRVYW
jgi:hypothetical protein